MPDILSYNRAAAIEYAKRWAMARNPRYLNFDGMGGDCTNFISQCLHAGCGVMNYTPDIGWYYNSPTDRAAGWSGVPYLHAFLTNNRGVGPFAAQTAIETLENGDIIQLGDQDGKWYHSLLVTGHSRGEPLVSTHTFDALMRPLSSYIYHQARYIKILGARR